MIRWVIRWLWARYPYLLMDAVIPSDAHLHKNPKRKKGSGGFETTMNPINPAVSGVDE